ncbi:hypothetical protein [Nocardia nepalensis]|uniref:hypothetical protein n=1 Tax=Nocardia nepalensis TaxID=3375448 RepID=UPI003B680DE1
MPGIRDAGAPPSVRTAGLGTPNPRAGQSRRAGGSLPLGQYTYQRERGSRASPTA